MMLSEFVERTGFEPMPAEYAKIEEAYCGFNGDKDAFCKAFVAGDGEKKIYQARAAEIDRLNGKILDMDKTFQQSNTEYERRLAALQAELDRELEWKPYEFTKNISQAEYAELAKCVDSGSARPPSEAISRTMDEERYMCWGVDIMNRVSSSLSSW